MRTIDEIIAEREIPDALTAKSGKKITTKEEFEVRRRELQKLIQEHVYGYVPEKPDHFSVSLISRDVKFCAGKAPLTTLNLTVTVDETEFSFQVKAVIPNSDKPLPAFVHIAFSDNVPDKFMPSEEIADGGFACFSFCYKDITDDNDNFKDKAAKILSPKRRTLTSPGKIAMWAWASMIVMDCIETMPEIDKNNVAVIGHSRLGKSALLAGAFDTRFKYVISNNSGCTGAAIIRGKVGENIAAITNTYGYWFSKKYAKYASCEKSLPLDQNFLTSLIAPRHLIIGSAEGDIKADPTSEFLSACIANRAYDLYGLQGLIHNGEIPKAKTVLDDGDICYHIRHGNHYLSREDWSVYMNYIKSKME